jgi:hypothetical protein
MGKYFQGEHSGVEMLLERHFKQLVERIESAPAVARRVRALVLGGGYGRGEGGVFEGGGGQGLYNDLDYFLFTDDPDVGVLRKWVHEVEVEFSASLGVDVEIKCLPLSEVEADPSASMMFYDLVAGHHVVWGDRDRLAALKPRLDSSRVGCGEAARLLWNRGSGLYFALCRINERIDTEFVQRNHQKCALALCDALLCARGRYDSSVVERLRRVRAGEAGDIGDELLEIYNSAVEFKLSPKLKDLSWAQLRVENAELCGRWEKVFLQIESERMGRPFESLKAYATGRKRLFRGEVPLWKGPLFAARDALRYRACLKPVWDYPRAALMRALCCLLDQRNHPTALGLVGQYLPPGESGARAGAPALVQWERAYEDWWRRYS